MQEMLNAVQGCRTYFESGATRPYAIRRRQLEDLRAAILRHEQAIQQALYADLKKSPEEAWITETGFVLAEIRHTLNHLKGWMKPERVGTNLLNFPSGARSNWKG
jgi:aldehyde dehydrogenase (NAD+)